jgi:hypothetical protein
VTSRACVARNYGGPNPVPFTASISADTSDPTSANNAANVSAALVSDSLFADGFDCG